MIVSSQSNTSLVLNNQDGRTAIINSIVGGSSSGSGTRVASQTFDVSAGSSQTVFAITDHAPLEVLFVFVNVNTMPPSTYSFITPDVTFNSAPGNDYPDDDFQIVIMYTYNA